MSGEDGGGRQVAMSATDFSGRSVQLIATDHYINYLTIMRGKFVCLSVCLPPVICHTASGVFCVAQSRTSTTAFEALGLKDVRHHFPLLSPFLSVLHGQLEIGDELRSNGVDSTTVVCRG